jgi:hypothetical protein
VTNGSFRGKPSKSHIIWTRETRNGATNKRFDYEHFEKWTEHCGFDFDTTTRVDHDRADEPRMQYRCVFNWGNVSEETIEFGDEEWSLGNQKTPRTFVEIDSEGLARLKGWNFETVLDITEMRHKGPELLIKTAGGDKKRLNGRKFVEHPRKRQREGN